MACPVSPVLCLILHCFLHLSPFHSSAHTTSSHCAVCLFVLFPMTLRSTAAVGGTAVGLQQTHQERISHLSFPPFYLSADCYSVPFPMCPPPPTTLLTQSSLQLCRGPFLLACSTLSNYLAEALSPHFCLAVHNREVD